MPILPDDCLHVHTDHHCPQLADHLYYNHADDPMRPSLAERIDREALRFRDRGGDLNEWLFAQLASVGRLARQLGLEDVADIEAHFDFKVRRNQ